jgi:hypothetical protein
MRTRKSRGERGARARSAQVFSSPSSSSRGADAVFLCTGTDSCASPDPSHSLFISCESLLNDCEIAPLNRVYVHEKARLSVHPLAENDSSGMGLRSASRSSNRMAAGFGPTATAGVARRSTSPCQRLPRKQALPWMPRDSAFSRVGQRVQPASFDA